MTCLIAASKPRAAGSAAAESASQRDEFEVDESPPPDVKGRGKRDLPRDPFGGSTFDEADRDPSARRGPGESRVGRRRPPESSRSPSRSVEIRLGGGCHRGVTRLYRPLARKRDRHRRAGTARLLHSSVGFGIFRAPIDSIMDPGGQPRRPTDPFLSLRCGFGPLKGCKARRLTLG